MEDVFAIQDEISTSIVNALRPKLLAAKRVAYRQRHTDDVEAYQLFLKGQHNWYKRDKDSLQKAAHFFEKAAERDPSYALAHAGIADAHNSLGVYGVEPGLASSKARAAVERALGIDDGLAEAHAALAYVRFLFDWDWEDAEREFLRALEINPSYVLAYCWYNFLLCCVGRSNEALTMMRRAQELDPLSPYVNTLAGETLLVTGNLEASLLEFQKVFDMDENSTHALFCVGGAYATSGQHDQAVRTLEEAALLAGRASWYLGFLGWGYGRAGLREKAEEVLEELSDRARNEYVSPVFRAWIYTGLGCAEDAFDMLEKGYQEKSPVTTFHWMPVFDELRAHPRFRDVLLRMKIEP